MVNLSKAFVTTFIISCLENTALHNHQQSVATTTHNFCSHPPRVTMGYIPDGLSKEQYEDVKRRDAAANKANMDRVGQNKFKSRSFEAFKKVPRERRVVSPIPGRPNNYKICNVKYEDLPTLSGVMWDNSDIKG